MSYYDGNVDVGAHADSKCEQALILVYKKIDGVGVRHTAGADFKTDYLSID